MLELAARSIGGLCSRSLRFAEGVSLETLILENSLGGRHSLPGMAGAAGVLMLPVERAGVLQRIDGQTDALAVPGITGGSRSRSRWARLCARSLGEIDISASSSPPVSRSARSRRRCAAPTGS